MSADCWPGSSQTSLHVGHMCSERPWLKKIWCRCQEADKRKRGQSGNPPPVYFDVGSWLKRWRYENWPSMRLRSSLHGVDLLMQSRCIDALLGNSWLWNWEYTLGISRVCKTGHGNRQSKHQCADNLPAKKWYCPVDMFDYSRSLEPVKEFMLLCNVLHIEFVYCCICFALFWWRGYLPWEISVQSCLRWGFVLF